MLFLESHFFRWMKQYPVSLFGGSAMMVYASDKLFIASLYFVTTSEDPVASSSELSLPGPVQHPGVQSGSCSSDSIVCEERLHNRLSSRSFLHSPTQGLEIHNRTTIYELDIYACISTCINQNILKKETFSKSISARVTFLTFLREWLHFS